MRLRLDLTGLVTMLTLLLVFASIAQWNYRSHDGRLGRTIPSWQAEIVSGTAPAPYVYRQGVPQLRRALGRWLQPGHAAVAVDLFFAGIALICGMSLSAYALGAHLRWTGGFVAFVAAAGVYPNDKPESVATVGAVLLLSALAVNGRHGWAAIVAAASAILRPELPVLFGCAFALATSLGGQATFTVARKTLAGYAAAAAIGVLYLFAAHFILWPDAHYPVGTPVLTLAENVTQAGRYSGLLLAIAAGSVGVMWRRTARAVRGRQPPREADESMLMFGLGTFLLLWSLAQATLGRTDEIRLLMPILPVSWLLAIGRWRPA